MTIFGYLNEIDDIIPYCVSRGTQEEEIELYCRDNSLTLSLIVDSAPITDILIMYSIHVVAGHIRITQ